MEIIPYLQVGDQLINLEIKIINHLYYISADYI